MLLIDRCRKAIKEYKGKPVNICVIGRGGSGKSSLLNALTASDKFDSGVETDLTVKASDVTIGNITYTDLPGYGTAKFSLDIFERDFNPEQYNLFLFVINGKLTSEDEAFSKKLFNTNRSIVAVRTHEDSIKGNKKKGITKEDNKRVIRGDILNKLRVSDLFFTGQGDDADELIGIEALREFINEDLNEPLKTSFTSWKGVWIAEQLDEMEKNAKKDAKCLVSYIIDKGFLGRRLVTDDERKRLENCVKEPFYITPEQLETYKLQFNRYDSLIGNTLNILTIISPIFIVLNLYGRFAKAKNYDDLINYSLLLIKESRKLSFKVMDAALCFEDEVTQIAIDSPWTPDFVVMEP